MATYLIAGTAGFIGANLAHALLAQGNEKRGIDMMYGVLHHLTGFEKQPLFAPARTGEVKDSLSDTTYSHEAMGYRPGVEFKEGLRQTVDWYKTEFASVSAAS